MHQIWEHEEHRWYRCPVFSPTLLKTIMEPIARSTWTIPQPSKNRISLRALRAFARRSHSPCCPHPPIPEFRAARFSWKPTGSQCSAVESWSDFFLGPSFWVPHCHHIIIIITIVINTPNSGSEGSRSKDKTHKIKVADLEPWGKYHPESSWKHVPIFRDYSIIYIYNIKQDNIQQGPSMESSTKMIVEQKNWLFVKHWTIISFVFKSLI